MTQLFRKSRMADLHLSHFNQNVQFWSLCHLSWELIDIYFYCLIWFSHHYYDVGGKVVVVVVIPLLKVKNTRLKKVENACPRSHGCWVVRPEPDWRSSDYLQALLADSQTSRDLRPYFAWPLTFRHCTPALPHKCSECLNKHGLGRPAPESSCSQLDADELPRGKGTLGKAHISRRSRH